MQKRRGVLALLATSVAVILLSACGSSGQSSSGESGSGGIGGYTAPASAISTATANTPATTAPTTSSGAIPNGGEQSCYPISVVVGTATPREDKGHLVCESEGDNLWALMYDSSNDQYEFSSVDPMVSSGGVWQAAVPGNEGQVTILMGGRTCAGVIEGATLKNGRYALPADKVNTACVRLGVV